MAKNIYICSRKRLPDSIGNQLHGICKKLAPDNITPVEPKVVVKEDIAYGVMNPTSTLLENDTSLLMGQIFGEDEKWFMPLQNFPDGSYALFRNGKEYCEIVSDPVGSRTIWYYMDENIFVASTSQRMIVMFIGSFDFDERVIPWMLSTGTLGPVFSWDKRIKRVPADSSVILDKKKWSISTKSNPIEFKLVRRSDEQHKKLLLETLKTSFNNLHPDYSVWALPLSGGYDSRGILCLLLDTSPDSHHIRTITWGLKSSLEVKGNDAFVAKVLVNELHVPNKYYINDLSDEPIERIIDRFIFLGEGLIDHLSDYVDGFKMWKNIFEDDIEGIIRGDECFGWNSVSSPLTVRLNVDLSLCSDFSNLKNYTKYGFPLQKLPQNLNRRKDETFSTWRDRLFQEYTQPVIQAALSDLKLSYVEQINPLLSKKILQQVRQLPDHLRTDRALFKQIVKSLSPEIDFPTSATSIMPEEILKQKQVADLLKNELSTNAAQKLFPGKFLDSVLKGIEYKDQLKAVKNNLFSLRSSILKIIPRFIKNAIRQIALPKVDPNILAFRLMLVCKMNTVLIEDSRNK